MADYTSLRVKVYIKEQYKDMIEQINDYEDWAEYVTDFPFLTKFVATDRSGLIPNGNLSYAPSHWQVGVFPLEQATEGFHRTFDKDSGLWAFQCSTANRGGEVELFIQEVLNEIVDKAIHI